MDTMVLSLAHGTYKVADPKRLTPYFEPVDSNNTNERISFLREQRGYKKYIQNPSASYRDLGLVYPNLRIDERIRGYGYWCDLKVSFSCPKLIHGHSFEEVMDSDFPQIVKILTSRLLDMGIVVTDKAIREAVVHILHYSSNIMFPSEAEARIFLNRLSNTSLNSWFENNSKTFANNGHAARFHTDIFEIVFYLKYYDVLETANKSVGRKTTLQEKETAKRLRKEGKIPPVVRMEIRFNGTRPIRNHLKAALGIDKQYWTFEEVFDSLQSRKTQKFYWDGIINDPLNRMYLSTTSDADVCRRVLEKYKGETTKDISEAMGLYFFVKNLGVRGAKEMIILRQNRKAWYDKRKKIIAFAKGFVNQDESLLKLVTSVLENKPLQLGLPL